MNEDFLIVKSLEPLYDNMASILNSIDFFSLKNKEFLYFISLMWQLISIFFLLINLSEQIHFPR